MHLDAKQILSCIISSLSEHFYRVRNWSGDMIPSKNQFDESHSQAKTFRKKIISLVRVTMKWNLPASIHRWSENANPNRPFFIMNQTRYFDDYDTRTPHASTTCSIHDVKIQINWYKESGLQNKLRKSNNLEELIIHNS